MTDRERALIHWSLDCLMMRYQSRQHVWPTITWWRNLVRADSLAARARPE